MKNPQWNVIVVGGGHAGCEAAYAAAKMGQNTLLITMTVDSIGAMSCNPAIGGLAKGHLVKEIDALGGVMGFVADETAIQFRILNRKKGSAVQATRCQSDMIAYKEKMRFLLEQQEGIHILQSEVAELLWKNNQVCGVKTSFGQEIFSDAVILTTGTFLGGLIHIGHQQFPAGRAWEFASATLSTHLAERGIQLGRLKTGTTPRLDSRTIDFANLEQQPGDEDIRKFSFWNSQVRLPQVPCHITYTNANTKEIIQENIKKSAMYSGAITGIGPRYCPSIEDKVSKFPERDRHQIFLEPTSLHSSEIYPNGMSTSLPQDVQELFLRSIEGLEQVEIVRPGYAIEYDFVLPTQLKSSLELKDAKNLYCAGQINGTSGYEEAAAQGLIAGINAARSNRAEEPFILLRNEAYIGVLIDDLVSKGTLEPYRMFTSRAEYRLSLREDNADQRLSKKGFELGLLSEKKYNMFLEKQSKIKSLQTHIQETKIDPSRGLNDAIEVLEQPGFSHRVNINDALKQSAVTLELIAEKCSEDDGVTNLAEWDFDVQQTVESAVKYAGYIKRQEKQLKQYLKIESIRIPTDFDYEIVGGLSVEVRQKLQEHRPQTLGQADKISGITPAAITALIVALQNQKKL